MWIISCQSLIQHRLHRIPLFLNTKYHAWCNNKTLQNNKHWLNDSNCHTQMSFKLFQLENMTEISSESMNHKTESKKRNMIARWTMGVWRHDRSYNYQIHVHKHTTVTFWAHWVHIWFLSLRRQPLFKKTQFFLNKINRFPQFRKGLDLLHRKILSLRTSAIYNSFTYLSHKK